MSQKFRNDVSQIVDELQEYLSAEECTDPLGYLETLELKLIEALTDDLPKPHKPVVPIR